MDNIEKEINKIWDNNPKIPFMQSKDILTLGYKYGIEKITKGIQLSIQSNSKEEDKKKEKKDKNFVGTTKEFIEYTNKEVTDKNKQKFGPKDSKTVYIKTKELDIEKARLTLISEICGHISANRDLLSTYEKLKSMRDESERKVRSLEIRYNK